MEPPAAQFGELLGVMLSNWALKASNAITLELNNNHSKLPISVATAR